MKLNTAILFLVFNRPDTTRKVFERIKKAKPPRLYVAADGPREGRQEESEKCKQVRKIATDVDWNCEVKTLFRDENLGCMHAVSGAIDWFFEQEKMGIILEDDCVPSQSFFRFCEDLLHLYQNDLRVWNIGGYTPSYLESDEFSYNFSRFTHIWGWATWADRWQHYDKCITKYQNKRDLLTTYDFYCEQYLNESRMKILDKILDGEIDTWDYQWDFTVRINHGLSIRPSKNLIGNIGFGMNATHTTQPNIEVQSNKPHDIDFPLKHPDFVAVHRENDKLFWEKELKNTFATKIRRFFNLS